ncbi:MAG: CDC48 family AAA ATPase [Candidatus Aenigmarchaeota archaeon]|nr:CDC48 family AAA ATPase [Candidatus Aenigmarchaeota archaeon]
MVGKTANGITLRVGELTNRSESGRGIARIDSRNMSSLGIREGDIVEIEGSKKTAAIAVGAYPADVGLNVIRIDGITRKNAGIGVGESVKVSKADVKDATKIVIAPADGPIQGFSQSDPTILQRNLFMRPVNKGDVLMPFPIARKRDTDPFFEDIMRNFGIRVEGMSEYSFMPVGSEARLMILSTSPEGIVRISENTKIELREEPVVIGPTAITYEDIGGLEDAIEKIREMVELPLRHPELFEKVGIEPPKGVLLYGPPGTGKTLLAKAVANESGANFTSINGPEIMDKFYGQSEANLRSKFEEAEKNAPSIIFIDEIDSIAPKREEVSGEVERRVVSQILTLMDGLNARGKVIVIAATNRPNALDPALRRPGRFDREIEIGVPDQKGRREILEIHTRNMPMDKSVNLKKLSSVTYGFIGADLAALCKEAAMSALRRHLPQISWKKEHTLSKDIIDKIVITEEDFINARRMVEPSAMREVMIEIPKVTWKDVGGLEEVKSRLKEMVEWPLKYPKSFENIGIKPPKGILLYGPPGTGKTMLAKAVANESGANFISIKGPEIMNKWVGESEKKIREIFKRAKQVAPSIIFFDEVDSLAPLRGLEMGSRVSENIVSQVLTEMSGLEDLHDVVVIAATNRPDMMDPALLRPGRFDRQILVTPPDKETRRKILEIHTRGMSIERDVNMKDIVRDSEGYTGADIEALVREAGMNALRRDMKTKKVRKEDFEKAFEEVKPSLNPVVKKFYDEMGERLKYSAVSEKKKKTKEDDDTRYLG